MIHRTGKGNKFSSIIKYCLQHKDHKGEDREKIEVIRGDEKDMVAMSKGLNEDNNAIHSILRFTPKENKTLSQETKSEILDSFIDQLAMGLPDKSRLAHIVVEHDGDSDSAHYHIVSLKIDTETSKTYQPWVVQRGDKNRFNAWNHVMSDMYGLDHPDEHPKIGGGGGSGNDQSLEQKKDKRYFERELTDLTSRGVIKDRDDMIDYLKENYKAEITRKSDNYLSFKLPEQKRAMRFNGHIFSKDFTGKDTIKDYVAKRNQRPEPAVSLAKLHKLESKVKAYNARRYDANNSNQPNKENPLLSKFDSLVSNALVSNAIKTPNLDLFNSIDFKQATEHCKTINLNNMNDYDNAALSRFVNDHNDFKDDYEKFYEDNHESIMNDDADIQDDKESYDDSNQSVFEAKNNLTQEFQQLENTVKQLEQTLQQETKQQQSKESQKTQKRAASSGGRQAPKPINVMAAVVAGWKAGEIEAKRNDARNYSIARKMMASTENKGYTRKPKKKKKDDK